MRPIGRLVDVDHLVDLRRARRCVSCAPDSRVAAVQRARERRVQDVVDERALARARHAGHARRAARAGTRRRRPCRLFSRAPTTDRRRPLPLRRSAGTSIASVAAEVAAGEAGLRLLEPARASRRPPPRRRARPAPGPKSISQSAASIVSWSCSTTTHRVADVAQVLERLEQLAVVALVQPDRRLVEHVDDAGQLGADLAREPDALALAARERGRRAVERQVVEPDVEQEAQPRADLLEQLRRDLGLRAVERERSRRRRRRRRP